MTDAALPGRARPPTFPTVTDDDGTHVRVICGDRSGGSAGRWTASRPTRATSTSRCRRDGGGRIPVALGANAFAYVFAGSGTFRDASTPRAVATELVGQGETPVITDVGNRSLVVFDRGDDVTVQAGDEGHPVPARVGPAHRGAGRLVRSHRDEHAGRTARGLCGDPRRHVHQAPMNEPSRFSSYLSEAFSVDSVAARARAMMQPVRVFSACAWKVALSTPGTSATTVRSMRVIRKPLSSLPR